MALSKYKYLIKRFCSFLRVHSHKEIHANIVVLGQNQLLEGRTALITGGTSGIGKAIAYAFLNAGADVIIAGRNLLKLESTLFEFYKEFSKDRVSGIVMDVADSRSIVNAIANLRQHIDILVNNAGISYCPSDDIINESNEFDRVLNTNLRGAYILSQLISKHMVENHINGNILNIASTSSFRPATNAYSLSKWGIRGLTIGFAKKLAGNDIVVNCIAPGPTATPMMNMDGVNDVSLPNNPFGRYTIPEEIANMAVILTSSIGRMTTGNIVLMGGGAGTITVDYINY